MVLTDDFSTLLLLTLLGSFAGLVGGIIFLLKRSWAKKLTQYAVPFAAGILLAVSFLHLIPEATHELEEVGFLIVLIAFIASFLFDQFFAHLHHHEHKETTMQHISVPLVIIGDTIHNFIDGVTIAAAFLVDPAFGLVVALATFLHETPHEIGDFGVLLSAGWDKTKTFIVNALSASATLPGAFLVYFFLRDAHDTISVLLAVSGGIFLYLGATDFLPEVNETREKEGKWKKVMMVILGVLIMYLLTFFTPGH
jgi:zinc and cadmium transporter